MPDLDFWQSSDKPVAKVLVHIVQYYCSGKISLENKRHIYVMS